MALKEHSRKSENFQGKDAGPPREQYEVVGLELSSKKNPAGQGEGLKPRERRPKNDRGNRLMKFMNALMSILEEQTACYEKIYQLKEQEQRLIVTDQGGELEQCVKEIEQMSFTIHKLENAREDIMEALANQYQLPQESMSFQKVIELADDSSARELQKIVNRLVEVLQRTSQINEDNVFLVRKSLDVIDRSLEILTGYTASSDTYSGDGRLVPNQNATVALDRQV